MVLVACIAVHVVQQTVVVVRVMSLMILLSNVSLGGVRKIRIWTSVVFAANTPALNSKRS